MSTLALLELAYPYRPAIRLPHGPHGLSRQQVKANQRQRMFMAVTESIRVRGANATKVRHVLELSGVSRRAFYEQFSDVRDCMVQAIKEAKR